MRGLPEIQGQVRPEGVSAILFWRVADVNAEHTRLVTCRGATLLLAPPKTRCGTRSSLAGTADAPPALAACVLFGKPIFPSSSFNFL